MCEHSIFISPHYTASLHMVFCFPTQSFFHVRNNFTVLETCQEILTSYLHMLLKFEFYGSYFTTSFLLHYQSR